MTEIELTNLMAAIIYGTGHMMPNEAAKQALSVRDAVRKALNKRAEAHERARRPTLGEELAHLTPPAGG